MHIRDIAISEAPAYRRLREQIDGETKAWGADPGERYSSDEEAAAFLQSIAEEPNSRILAVEEDGRLAGFLSAVSGRWRRSKHYVSVDIGILKQYWGRGIGRALLETAESWARSRGIRRLELFVSEENLRARKLYESAGFEIEGIRRESLQVDGRFVNEIWMGKLVRRTPD